MTVERKNGATKKVDFVVARYANEFKRMTKSQQEWVKTALEALFEWTGPEGYTISPAWVQVLYLREPQILLHWRCWADIAWAAGYRWRFEEFGPIDNPIGTAIYFWHKDNPEEIYTFRMRYKDYEGKIRRWAQMDLEVMVCKTLLRNAIAFFAPHVAAREPFALVATYDEYDLPAEPAAPVAEPAPEPDDRTFRQKVTEIIKARGIDPEAVKVLLHTNYNASRLEELTQSQRAELLELLSA